jgi:hypothetical protein
MTAMMSLMEMMFLALAVPTSGWPGRRGELDLVAHLLEVALELLDGQLGAKRCLPSAACPPDGGLCEAILMVPLDWASTGYATGSAARQP